MSTALITWRSNRLVRFDRLLAVHPDSNGSVLDPAVAGELTRALVLQLAGEFQGFSRDLHDEAVRAMVSSIGTPSSRLRSTVLDNLVHGRRLNRGNADPGTLEEDFSRLG